MYQLGSCAPTNFIETRPNSLADEFNSVGETILFVRFSPRPPVKFQEEKHARPNCCGLLECCSIPIPTPELIVATPRRMLGGKNLEPVELEETKCSRKMETFGKSQVTSF